LKLARWLVGVGVAVVVVGLILYVRPIPNDQNETWYVEPFSTIQSTAVLDRGERLEGFFTVGGGDEQVRFWVKDPNGVIIYNAGTVNSRADCVFTAESSGAYTLYFDNGQDVEKTIYFTRSRNAAFLGIVGALAGLLIAILGLVSVGQDWSRARKTAIQKRKC
jgi:hypothetical protein